MAAGGIITLARSLPTMVESFRVGAAQLRALAHRFLSATQNIGATRLSRLCAELERLAKGAQLGAAAALLADLAIERDRVHTALLSARIRY